MPVMDGIAATRHIRTFEQQNSVLPVNIVAVTGVGSTTTKQHATSAGIDDYMIKPVSLQQLRSVVDNIRN